MSGINPAENMDKPEVETIGMVIKDTIFSLKDTISYHYDFLFNVGVSLALALLIGSIIYLVLTMNSRPYTWGEKYLLKNLTKEPRELYAKVDLDDSGKINNKRDRFNLNANRAGVSVTYYENEKRKKTLIYRWAIPVFILFFFLLLVILLAPSQLKLLSLLGFYVIYRYIMEVTKYDRLVRKTEKELKGNLVSDLYNFLSVYRFKPTNYEFRDFLEKFLNTTRYLRYDFILTLSDMNSFNLSKSLDRLQERIEDKRIIKFITFIKGEEYLTQEQSAMSMTLLYQEFRMAVKEYQAKVSTRNFKGFVWISIISFGLLIPIGFIPPAVYMVTQFKDIM